MKHRVVGRKLGRTSAHRLALLRNLSTELFDKEKITTTLGKAKELRPFAEKLVTLSKRETLHARRRILRHIHDRDVVAKLFETLSARYAQRPGGYTRILKLGARRGDGAEMAVIELVGAETAPAAAPESSAKPKRRAAAGKPAAAAETESAKPAGKAKRKAAPKKAAAATARRKKAAPERETPPPKKKAARKKTGPKSKGGGKEG